MKSLLFTAMPIVAEHIGALAADGANEDHH